MPTMLPFAILATCNVFTAILAQVFTRGILARIQLSLRISHGSTNFGDVLEIFYTLYSCKENIVDAVLVTRGGGGGGGGVWSINKNRWGIRNL